MLKTIYFKYFSFLHLFVNPLPLVLNNPKAGLSLLRSSVAVIRNKDKGHLPFRLQLEVSSACNLKCNMCPQTLELVSSGSGEGFLAFDDFKKIFLEINPGYLDLTGYGEPFLNPEIFRMIEFGKKQRSIVKVNTNGTLLDKRMIEQILTSGLDLLPVSLDGSTKATHEKIRKGADFDKIIDSLKALGSLKKQRRQKTPKINVHMTVSKDNMHEITDMINFCHRHLQLEPVFQSLFSYAPEKMVGLEIKDREELKKIFNSALLLARRMKFNETAKSVTSNLMLLSNNKSSQGSCFLPWFTVYVNKNGGVLPCCYFCADKHGFGNILKDTFKNIWASEKYEEFRRNVYSSKAHYEICKRCHIEFNALSKVIKKLSKFVKK